MVRTLFFRRPKVTLRRRLSPPLFHVKRFVGLMEKHGFVVLTEVGAIRKAYLGFMQLLKAFFEGGPDWKETKKGGVHFNERGIPMVKRNTSKNGQQRRRVCASNIIHLCDPRQVLLS